jgi:hypothetical protein
MAGSPAPDVSAHSITVAAGSAMSSSASGVGKMRRGWQVMGQHRRALQHLSIDRLACEAIFPRREASQECGDGGVERKKWAWADRVSLVSEAPPACPNRPAHGHRPQGPAATALSPILRRLPRSHWTAQRLAASRSGRRGARPSPRVRRGHRRRALGAVRVKSGFIFPIRPQDI